MPYCKMSTKLIPVVSSLHISQKVEKCYVHKARETFIHRQCRGIHTTVGLERILCKYEFSQPLLSFVIFKIFVPVERIFPPKQCLLDPTGFILSYSTVHCNGRHLMVTLLCLDVTLQQDFTMQYQISGAFRATAQEGQRPSVKCSHHRGHPILLEQMGQLALWVM